MTQWWRVQPPIDAEFLVLVAGGRIAAHTGVGKFFIAVGNRWDEKRKWFEDAGFVCTMETL